MSRQRCVTVFGNGDTITTFVLDEGNGIEIQADEL